MQCMEVWGGNSPVDRSVTTPGLGIWIHSSPYKRAERGGDVYYLSSCASGRITRLLLADVSGHGTQAADVAIRLRNLMRGSINLINQNQFVREINRQFSEQRNQTKFATALVCTFFSTTRTLQFSNAGHPTPLLYRAADSRWSFASDVASIEQGKGCADMPLGVVDDTDYSRFVTKLSEGDMMLCVSDAFTESVDSDGKLLASAGLMKIVQEIDVSQPADVIPQLLERISLQHEGNLTQDDATALLFRADGSSVSLKNNLLAPLRLFGPVHDRTTVV